MRNYPVRAIVAFVLAAPCLWWTWLGIAATREGGYAALVGPPLALGGVLLLALAVRFGLRKPDPDSIDWPAWGWLVLFGFVLLNKLFYVAH